MAKKFWLKLDEHFFEQDEIIYLDSRPNGDKYIKIWLKLLLKCLKSDGDEGILRFNEFIPYDESMLAEVLREDPDHIKAAFRIFKQLQMIDILDDGTIYIEAVQKMIGKENTSTERVYRHRAKRKMTEKKIPLISNCDDDKRYGGNYYTVMQRDEYKCISCGSEINLCVHHIIGYRAYDLRCNELSCLAVLCRKCHSTEHAVPYSIITDQILRVIGFNFELKSLIHEISDNSGKKLLDCNENCNVTVTDNIEVKKEEEVKKSKKEVEKESIVSQCKKVIDFFNEITGKSSKYAESNYKQIRERLREGFTAEDFRKVFFVKNHQWKNDPKMKQYIRLSTLTRSSKFNDYLNEYKDNPDYGLFDEREERQEKF